MTRPALTNGLLTAALVVCGLLVAMLAYGFATSTLAPTPAPERAEAAPPDTSGQARALAAARARITVDIKNATGVNGLAARARTLLQARGFDVLEVGTVPKADTTTVTVLKGTRADAANVAGALGLPQRRIIDADSARVSENDLTVRITIGRDYTKFSPLDDL